MKISNSTNIAAFNYLGLISKNSIDYISQAFRVLESETILVPLQDKNDAKIKKLGIEKVIESKADTGWFTPSLSLQDKEDVSVIMFTSGTEGEPKGVLLSSHNLNDAVSRLQHVLTLDSTVREYIGVPVYHSFGFGRCRHVASAGGQAYIPKQGFNPGELAQLIEHEGVNALSVVPSLLRVLLNVDVLSLKQRGLIKWVEIGSQYLSAQEKIQVREYFPKAKIVQHYGLTEASRTSFLRIHDCEEKNLESVGQPDLSTSIKITEDGRIGIKGDHVAKGLLIGEEMVRHLDQEGWFITNDLGEFKDNYLTFLGRADDVINCGGIKVSPDQIEMELKKEYTNLSLVILRIPNLLRGDGVGLVVESSNQLKKNDELQTSLINVVHQILVSKGINAKDAIKIAYCNELPKSDTGKIQRKKLSHLFAGIIDEQGTKDIVGASNVEYKSNIDKIFSKYLALDEIGPNDTFISLGGDSLAFIQISVALENEIGEIPDDWESIPIADLKLRGQKEKLKSWMEVSSMVWLRALAIAVIASNSANLFGHVKFYGGAYFLFVLAGMSFARFQLQRITLQGRASIVLESLPKLVLPVLGLLMLEQIRTGNFIWPQWFFVSNLISPELGGYWFIDVWIQTYLVIFILFLVLPMAKWNSSNSDLLAVSILGAGVMAALLAPYFWNTDDLYNRVPQSNFWMFALGWCIYVFKDRYRLALSLFSISALILFGIGPATVWVCLGSLALLWLGGIKIPNIMGRIISGISAASLYIYITQGYSISITQKLLEGTILSTLSTSISWLAALGVGFVTFYAIELIWPQLIHAKNLILKRFNLKA